MSTEAGFLQAIIQQPDDDMPRLVYADWLEEHGDSERAEFIRIQCQLARMSPKDPGYGALEVRQIRLFRWYGWQWWYEPFHPDSRRPIFRRGFADELEIIEGSYFLSNAEALLKCYPLLRDLTLRYLAELHVPSILAISGLSRLASVRLCFCEPISPSANETICRCFGDRVRFLANEQAERSHFWEQITSASQPQVRTTDSATGGMLGSLRSIWRRR